MSAVPLMAMSASSAYKLATFVPSSGGSSMTSTAASLSVSTLKVERRAFRVYKLQTQCSQIFLLLPHERHVNLFFQLFAIEFDAFRHAHNDRMRVAHFRRLSAPPPLRFLRSHANADQIDIRKLQTKKTPNKTRINKKRFCSCRARNETRQQSQNADANKTGARARVWNINYNTSTRPLSRQLA